MVDGSGELGLRLLSHLAVVDTNVTYAWAIDSGDYTLFEEIFAPNVRSRYPSGRYASLAELRNRMSTFHAQFAATQHSITNDHVAFPAADRAFHRSYVTVRLVGSPTPMENLCCGASYEDHLHLSGDRWLIVDRTCRLFWIKRGPAAEAEAPAFAG